MATVVLTVVGGVLGGPVGAALGGALGNAIDRTVLFTPAAREGPRLSELAVQTSSYGAQIPRLFGRMRVAGSVIWATELVEHRSTEGGGKGSPKTTSYSYTASFAVALSGRPIVSVGRIWADGKLLRGSAGDFKTRTGYRLHLGGEDQAADPLIASAEGAGLAPAHRGIAYAVFENLELGDFGNRIPSLTFEVTADAGGAAIGDILEEVSGGAILGAEETRVLGGFSAHGSNVRAVAETLAGAEGAWFVAEGARLRLMRGSGAAVALGDAGVRAGRGASARGARTIAAADNAPRIVSLSHYDPARDYQIGVQRATRPGAGNREARVELPASVSASDAKSVAEAMLARLDTERERRTVSLGWDALAIAPGARVTIAGAPGLWRVARWSFEAMVVKLECVSVAPASLPVSASGGRVLAAPDAALGETLLHAFELPPLDESVANAPRLAVAGAGTAPGWRSAALLLSTDGGERWDVAGDTALPAVLGEIAETPGWAPATLLDTVNSLEVVLAHGGMALGDADAATLDAGGNLAMAGDELIQFARAEPLGANRWKLAGLWRGRRGTEQAIGTQSEGDRFTLLTPGALAVIDLPIAALGTEALLLAEGAGDVGGPAEASAVVAGISVTPPSPVHLTVEMLGGGDTLVRWIRRSRAGWRWLDGVDAPLAEETERYRVTIAPEGAPERSTETALAQIAIAAADRESASLVTVRQIGSHGISLPAAILLAPFGES